jgi:broad specificity phosphatase PhoE
MSTRAETSERAIWLARHGRRRDFDDPEWVKRAPRPHDPPLSAEGRRQAQALADRLAGVGLAHLFSSPFLRCVETAAPIAQRLGLAIRIERGLSEWLNSEWFPEPPELLPLAGLARRFPRVDATHRPRGEARYGESGSDALRRSGETALQLVAEFEGSLLMVGHGASVLGATAALSGRAPEDVPDLAYGGLIRLVQAGGHWIPSSLTAQAVERLKQGPD